MRKSSSPLRSEVAVDVISGVQCPCTVEVEMGAACTGLAGAGQGWGAALVRVTWCCGRPGKCSSGALAPLCGGTSHAGLEAPLVSGEAALSGASEVEDLSLIPLGLRCRFPNSTGKPLPLVCVEKAQLRPASFSAEGICLSA